MHRDLPRLGSAQREHYGGKRRLHASRRHHPDGGRQTTVTDVWRPRDGSFYAADIASKFPTCARRQLWEYDDGVQQRVLSLQNRTKALLYFVAHPQP